MYKGILKDLKNNKSMSIMLLLVFTIIMFVTSLSISFACIGKDSAVDHNRGDINEQKIIDIKGSNGDYLDVNKIIKTCSKFTTDSSIDIRGFSYRKKDEINNKNWIVPIELISINESNQWTPKVIYGRYFNKEEIHNNEKVAVVGDSVVKNKICNTDTVNILNNEFTVIGQVGELNNNKSDYIGTIFIPLNSAPEDIKKDIKELQVRIYNKKEVQKQAQLLINELHSESEVYIEEIKLDNSEVFYKSLLKTTIIIFIIVIITIINILMFLSYYLNKKNSYLNELKNLKVNILKSKPFCIIISLNFLAVFISLIIQNSVNTLIKNNFIGILDVDSFPITYVNIIILIILSSILSVIICKVLNRYENEEKTKLILIKSKRFKKIIYTLQLIITFVSLNIILLMIGKSMYWDREFNSVMECNNTYNISVSADKNTSALENLNKSFMEIKNNQEVKKSGRYYFDKIKINDNDYRGLFIDNIDMYKFNIIGSSNFLKNSDVIGALVSEDLSNIYNVGDSIKLSINNNDIEGEVLGLIKKGRFLSTNSGDETPIEDIKNTVVIPFGKEYFYDKNIDYGMFSNIVAIGNSENFQKILEGLKNNNLISGYSRHDTFLENIKKEYKASSGLLALITLIFFVFSLAGVIGANSYYGLLGNHKFIIKRVFFILIIAMLISIPIYKYLF